MDSVIFHMKHLIGSLSAIKNKRFQRDGTAIAKAKAIIEASQKPDPYLIDNDVYPAAQVNVWIDRTKQIATHLMLSSDVRNKAVFQLLGKILRLLEQPLPKNKDGDYMAMPIDMAAELMEAWIDKFEIGYANTLLNEELKKAVRQIEYIHRNIYMYVCVHVNI